MEGLKNSKSVNYSSDKDATEMLESIVYGVRKRLDNQLLKPPFLSVLADESTDIGVKKKLVRYRRVVDEKLMPKTHYMCNVELEKTKRKSIAESMLQVIKDKNIPIKKVMGLGSDRTKVMTGTGEGVTGCFLRETPKLLNFHCIAHMLALVSSQAANQVSYLKQYQDTLCSMFYFFKASASRT